MPKSWSKPYLTVLNAHVRSWKDAKSAALREATIEAVAQDIQQLRLDKDTDATEIPGLHKKISIWFGNNVSKADKPETTKPKYVKPLTLRDVVKNLHKNKIHELLSKETDAQVGHKDWLRRYPATLTKVMEGLSEAELEDAEKMLEEWNASGVPKEIQQQNAEKWLAEEVKTFLHEIHQRTGAQLFVLAAFQKTNDSICVTKFQTKPHHGGTFVQEMPKWKKDTWAHWQTYVSEQYGNDDDSDDDTDAEGKKTHMDFIKVHEKLGWPIMPKKEEMSLDQMKGLLRAYVTATYRSFTNNKRVSVPWKALSQDSKYEYVDSASLPDGMVLLDPSKLREVGIEDVWRYWTERQKEGKQGLVFLKAMGGDMREKVVKGKKKAGMEYVEEDEEDEGGDNTDREEGGSKDKGKPHPESPGAHCESLPERLNFLAGLSDDKIYQGFLQRLPEKLEIERGALLKHLPSYIKWRSGTKYLPAEFHTKTSLKRLLALAGEKWENMGQDAQFVVLCMGLALRDVSATHFTDEEEGAVVAGDLPPWVKVSPWKMADIHEVMEVWGQQLGEDDMDVESSDEDKGGKGKKKARDRQGAKRKEGPTDEEESGGKKKQKLPPRKPLPRGVKGKEKGGAKKGKK